MKSFAMSQGLRCCYDFTGDAWFVALFLLASVNPVRNTPRFFNGP
jgi:hypothetical protein